MGVRIDQINVEVAGPITGRQLPLGPFNLIYGHNEQGKTFLVEFVIRALFKNLSGWTLRETENRGKIVVSGLTEKPLSLMPSSKRKLEDYLAKSEPGMPSQISRLLVVKGAELSFENGRRSGISKDVLKEFLSGQGVLDDVQKRISKTVQSAKVEDGRIGGKKVGEIKSRNNLSSSLESIDDLFEQIEAIYSGGERQALQVRVQELEDAVAEQEKARCHHAYQIHQNIRQHDKYLDRLPKDELDRLEADFNNLQETQNRISRHEKNLADLAQQSEHYEWLEEAIAVYEMRAGQGKVAAGPVYPTVIIFALLLAVVFGFIGFPLGTFVLIIIAAIVGWLYLRQHRSALDHVADVDEIRKLEAEYQSRFGQPLSGLPQLKARKKSMEEAYHGSKTLSGELAGERENLADLQGKISSLLQRLMGKVPEPERWDENIKKLRNLRDQVQDKLNQYQMELAALGLDETEYQAEPAAVEYSPKSLAALQGALFQAKEDLQEKTGDLNNLKQRTADMTRDEISTDWETLIQNLQLAREDAAADYREVTAKILAGILVNEQLDVIRAQEEEKIREKLALPMVSKPIQSITRRYSGVRYNDGRLWLTDDFGQFALADLSTGAREQVLLGLRLGFAAHILGKDRLFLLLDDAFQHADWQRRERLLDQMIGLAKDGWQIIYFTMDDHIRDLFNDAGQTHFPGHYQYHELNA